MKIFRITALLALIGSTSALFPMAAQRITNQQAIHNLFHKGSVAEVQAYLDQQGTLDVRISGLTPFHIAAMAGNYFVVNFLKDRVPDIDVKSDSNQTPLFLAAFNGRKDIITLLQKAGADINATNEYNQTALYAAALASRTESVRELLRLGANFTIKTSNGLSPLEAAARSGDYGSVLLIAQAIRESILK